MNYLQYYQTDVVNGEGTRCVLFVSGCEHACKGCYNKVSWKPHAGAEFTKEMEDQIIADLNDTRIKRKGLTLSGGDPLHPANRASVLHLCERVWTECHGKDIWLYTGYTLAELNAMDDDRVHVILELIDVLVDGKYVEELRDPNLAFRGSSNQIIHRFRTI